MTRTSLVFYATPSLMITYKIIAILLTVASGALAQSEGILPGEPDPNKSPAQDAQDEALIDDRDHKSCLKGMKRFQKMKCAKKQLDLDCANYSPIMECRKKAEVLKCKKPDVPMPIYRCE